MTASVLLDLVKLNRRFVACHSTFFIILASPSLPYVLTLLTETDGEKSHLSRQHSYFCYVHSMTTFFHAENENMNRFIVSWYMCDWGIYVQDVHENFKWNKIACLDLRRLIHYSYIDIMFNTHTWRQSDSVSLRNKFTYYRNLSLKCLLGSDESEENIRQKWQYTGSKITSVSNTGVAQIQTVQNLFSWKIQ